jgi:hypothetical protein
VSNLEHLDCWKRSNRRSELPRPLGKLASFRQTCSDQCGVGCVNPALNSRAGSRALPKCAQRPGGRPSSLLRKVQRPLVRSAMNLLFLCVVGTQSSTAAAMKLHGGGKPKLIQPSLLARYGLKPIRWRIPWTTSSLLPQGSKLSDRSDEVKTAHVSASLN